MSETHFILNFIQTPQNKPSTIEDFFLVEKFLYSYRNKQNISPCVLITMKKILDAHGAMHIDELSAPVGCCSQRQIERLFKLHIGVSPKKFSEIIQFKFTLELLKKRDLPLIEVALSAGYFDQAHFIHSFKKFTGISPDKFLKLPSQNTHLEALEFQNF